MSTGEQAATVTVPLRGNAGLGVNNLFTDLKKQLRNMSAEERESARKRLLGILNSLTNGGSAAG